MIQETNFYLYQTKHPDIIHLFEDIFICCHVKNILDEECVVFGWLAWMAEW